MLLELHYQPLILCCGTVGLGCIINCRHVTMRWFLNYSCYDVILLLHDCQELHYVLCFMFYGSLVCLFLCVRPCVCFYVYGFYAWNKLMLCYAMLKSALTCLRAPYDHNARPSQKDRQADKDHGNSATIRSKAHIARYKAICWHKNAWTWTVSSGKLTLLG